MASIELRYLTKTFDGGVRAVDNFSLTVADGEFVVMVGPSGCGKSTLLRIVAGLESPTDGEILLGGRTINELAPQQRNVAMVFQNYALYPHKTVRENLAFPLRMTKTPKDEREKRIHRAAELLGLTPLLDRRPKALSGGQRQRVAMGRAIVRDPEAFLMDEPLSNLDAKLRGEIRGEIADLQRRLGITTLYVTHDQVEAMTLGDRIALLDGGRLQQLDTARAIYERPANTFVATFVGSPSMNLFRSRLTTDEHGAPQLDFGVEPLRLDRELFDRIPKLVEYREGSLLIGLRPEAFAAADDAPAGRRMRATVEATEELGHERIVYLEPPVEMVTTSANKAEARATRMVARLPASAPARKGDPLTLRIHTDALYFFDPAGQAIPIST